MGRKEVYAKIKAKYEDRHNQQKHERAAKALRNNNPRGDGNVFTIEEMDAMERAVDRSVKSN